LLPGGRAGKYLADIGASGGGTSTSLYKAKALIHRADADALEVKDASKWLDGQAV